MIPRLLLQLLYFLSWRGSTSSISHLCSDSDVEPIVDVIPELLNVFRAHLIPLDNFFLVFINPFPFFLCIFESVVFWSDPLEEAVYRGMGSLSSDFLMKLNESRAKFFTATGLYSLGAILSIDREKFSRRVSRSAESLLFSLSDWRRMICLASLVVSCRLGDSC